MSSDQSFSPVQRQSEADTYPICELSFYLASVSAGFPSPADDYLEGFLDLNQFLIRKPAATFYVRVAGNSMSGAGILSGDVLVVDRSIDPSVAVGQIVIAILDGELTVKRLEKRQRRLLLVAANPEYPPIAIADTTDLEIWGVVIGVVRKLCNRKSLP